MPLRARLTSIAITSLTALLICLPWTVHAVLAVKRFNNIEASPVDFGLAAISWSDDGRAALERLPAFARLDNFEAINYWSQRQRLAQVTAADVERFFHEMFDFTPKSLSPVVFISNQGPMSFALANHPQSGGGFSRAAFADARLGSDPKFAFSFPPHNRVFNEGWRIGWGYIKDDPREWLKLVGRKLQRFADGITYGFGAKNLPLGREGVRQPVDMLVADSTIARSWQIVFITLLTAGLVLALARRMPIGLWLLIIIYKLIVTILFYGYARQAASIGPAFLILIAIPLDALLLILDRRWPGWMRWQAIVAALLCAGMLIGDSLMSRRSDRIGIVGNINPRPDLDPAAFESFDRIEIRNAP